MMTTGRRGVYRKVVDGEDSYNILVGTDKVKDKPLALLQDFHHKENNSMVERQDFTKLFSTDINASLINEESANSMNKFSNTEISETLSPQNSKLVSKLRFLGKYNFIGLTQYISLNESNVQVYLYALYD